MATAAELRAEAARMRAFARTVTDPDVLAEIHAMIARSGNAAPVSRATGEEWERRAREQGNGASD